MNYNEQSNTGSDISMSNSGHFKDYEFMPAVIIENKDPLNYGRIKVTAPGVFNGNNTDPELLPWCYPWMMFGNATYSTMEKGSKVWLIKNEKRQDECWYVPMYELHTAAQDFLTDNRLNKPEIVSYRNNGGDCDYIRYNNYASSEVSSGKSDLHASNNGVHLVSGGGGINIDNKGTVSLGPATASAAEPVVLGQTLFCLLSEINTILDFILFEFERDVPEFDCGKAESIRNSLNDIYKNLLNLCVEDSIKINESHIDKAAELRSNRNEQMSAPLR